MSPHLKRSLFDFAEGCLHFALGFISGYCTMEALQSFLFTLAKNGWLEWVPLW